MVERITKTVTKTVTLTGSQLEALDVLRDIAIVRRDDYESGRNCSTSHPVYTVQEKIDDRGTHPHMAWVTIRICMTSAGAQRLTDGHGNRRVRVDSAHNMPEMRALYAALDGLLQEDE